MVVEVEGEAVEAVEVGEVVEVEVEAEAEAEAAQAEDKARQAAGEREWWTAMLLIRLTRGSMSQVEGKYFGPRLAPAELG